MKKSTTLRVNSHTLEAMKKKFTGRSLSFFTNDLYANWLKSRKREELITAYERAAKNKTREQLYSKIAESMEGSIEDWIYDLEGR